MVVSDPFVTMIRLSTSPDCAVLFVSSKTVLARMQILRGANSTFFVEIPTVRDNKIYNL